MKKILIVDNHKSSLELQKNILNNRGLEIFTATGGGEALTLHKKEKFDLIVTGLEMPEMDGDELCSHIRHDTNLKKVSVIIVCNNSRPHLDRCAGCGANAYITKPIDPAGFIEKVGRLINIPKRSGMRVLIKVQVKGRFRYEAFFCTSVNISVSGVLIESDRVLSKGDAVTCSFFIPGSNSITVDCEVMRVAKAGPDTFQYGVKFLALHPVHKRAIEEFVRKKTG